MTHSFEIGGRYRTFQAEYEVLSIEGEKMTVRFADGTEQRLTTGVQERIWRQVSLEAANQPPPPAPARSARRPRRQTPVKTNAAYHLSDSAPIVARVIRETHNRTGDWVSHDEIIAGLLVDEAGRTLIDQAKAADGAETETPQVIAGRFKAWFSRLFSQAGSTYSRQFERSPAQPYGYRPQG